YAVRWTIRPPMALQSRTACFHGFPLSTSKGPPNLFVTSRIVDSTTLSSWSAMITPSAPRARAVRQTWVVTRESLKTLWPLRRMNILANVGEFIVRVIHEIGEAHKIGWQGGSESVRKHHEQHAR